MSQTFDIYAATFLVKFPKAQAVTVYDFKPINPQGLTTVRPDGQGEAVWETDGSGNKPYMTVEVGLPAIHPHPHRFLFVDMSPWPVTPEAVLTALAAGDPVFKLVPPREGS